MCRSFFPIVVYFEKEQNHERNGLQSRQYLHSWCGIIIGRVPSLMIWRLINTELGSLLGTSHDFRESDFTINDWIEQECDIQLHETHSLDACIYVCSSTSEDFHFCLCIFFFFFFGVFGFVSWLTHARNTTCDSHPPACTCEILNASDSMYILNQVILVSELTGWS